MKTPLQLMIDAEYKKRLNAVKELTGISIARLISDLLEEHLPEIERKYNTLANQKRKPPMGDRPSKK